MTVLLTICLTLFFVTLIGVTFHNVLKDDLGFFLALIGIIMFCLFLVIVGVELAGVIQ